VGEEPGERPKSLALLGDDGGASWASSLDRVLPDGGLPRGAVVEVASAHGLARATSLALLACAAAQREARLRSGDAHTVGAWCAFVDPWSTLNAPALADNGVDATRLLVVRPPLDSIARIAVRIAESRAFSLVVIDTVGVPGAALAASHMVDSAKLERWPTVVRRLSIAVERSDTTIVLLTDTTAPRALPLPVSMRLELSRTLRDHAMGDTAGPDDQWLVRVAKERHGRVSPPIAIAS
jgi:RecA/RadA recombinase